MRLPGFKGWFTTCPHDNWPLLAGLGCIIGLFGWVSLGQAGLAFRPDLRLQSGATTQNHSVDANHLKSEIHEIHLLACFAENY